MLYGQQKKGVALYVRLLIRFTLLFFELFHFANIFARLQGFCTYCLICSLYLRLGFLRENKCFNFLHNIHK